jgi:hypothetical protein
MAKAHSSKRVVKNDWQTVRLAYGMFRMHDTLFGDMGIFERAFLGSIPLRIFGTPNSTRLKKQSQIVRTLFQVHPIAH